jgi:hypothetical protein
MVDGVTGAHRQPTATAGLQDHPGRGHNHRQALAHGAPQQRLQNTQVNLKGHGNEADFLGFLQKLVPRRSLTLPFEPFRFCLRIRGDIPNRKTTLRLSESGSR